MTRGHPGDIIVIGHVQAGLVDDGFITNSHQNSGFRDLVSTKTADVVRIYLPPDANTLLSVADHCPGSTNYINVIVAGKQPALQYMAMPGAKKHCAAGMGEWGRGEPPELTRTRLPRRGHHHAVRYVAMNHIDRYPLAIDAVNRVDRSGQGGKPLIHDLEHKPAGNQQYTREHGEDPPEISE